MGNEHPGYQILFTCENSLENIPIFHAYHFVKSRNLSKVHDSDDPGISKRQQTLQSTIEWSYNLLSEEEKLLYTRLGVFVGGFDISAVEEVCADDQLLKESIHTYFLLGMDYLERALSMDVKKSEFYARAQYGLGMFLWFTGDVEFTQKARK